VNCAHTHALGGFKLGVTNEASNARPKGLRFDAHSLLVVPIAG
jgi:hypothetical protein